MAELGKLIQYDKIKKVKLGEIRDSWSHDLRPNSVKGLINFFRALLLLNFFENRRFKKIRKSLIKNGYNPEKYGYIQVFEKNPEYSSYVDVSSTPSPYRAKDGNHRVKILKELYGENHEIAVMVSVNAPDPVKEINSTWGELWDGITKLPIITIPAIVYFLWYMFFDVIIVSVTCYFFMMFTKDIAYKAKIDSHPKKGWGWIHDNAKFIYEVLMTIYYNYRKIILILIIAFYTYHVVTTHLIGLLILGGVSLIMRFLFERLFDNINISFYDLKQKIKK